MDNNINKKTFLIQLQGKTLTQMTEIAKVEYRSVTKQIIKLIDDFIESKEVKPEPVNQ